MSSILLCLCPAWGVEMPPFALALLKGFLNKCGHNTECLDLNHKAWRNMAKPQFWEKNSLRFWTDPELFNNELKIGLSPLIEKWACEIISHPAVAIGFSCYESNYRCTNLLIEKLRAKGCQKKIIIGGPLAFCRETRIKISDQADYVQIGEGEEALDEWLKYLEKGGGPLPESVYRRNFIKENYQDFPLRKIHGPNAFPIPDFSDFSINSYETRALPLAVSRGCLFNCAFCADSPLSRPFRKMEADGILDNLHRIYKCGYRLLWFNDLLINGVITELTTAFHQLDEMGIKMEWTALATPEQRLSVPVLQELAQNGCISLNLGLESGSDQVLKLMRKAFNRATAIETIKNIFKAGIRVQLNLLVGFPGETEANFRETISLLNEVHPYINGFTSVNTCIVLPGSHLFLHKEEYGIEFPPSQDPTQWSTGTENTPEIRSERMSIAQEWIKNAGLKTWNTNYDKPAAG